MRCALLHGFAGTPSAWDAVIAAWPPDVRASLAPIALPGHGGGPVRETWEANLAALGMHDVVIGYSLGARVALGLLAQDQCRRAVLISVNPGLRTEAEREARRAGDAVWAAMLRERGVAGFADAWEAQPLFATQAARVDPDVLSARRTKRLGLDAEQLARSLERMGLGAMPDYHDVLVAAGAAGRAHLVVGADDPKFTALAEATGLPVTYVPDSGHDPTLEQPAALAARIAQLLASPSAQPIA